MADPKNARPGGFHSCFHHTGLTAGAAFTIDQTTDKVVVIFQTKTLDPITRLGFRYNLRTGTPVQHRIGLQGVDTAGNQDGTYKGGGSPANQTFTPPASTAWDSTWQWITLANAYTPANVGEFLAYVIEPVGTPDGSNNSAFTVHTNNADLSFPYSIQINAGTPTRNTKAPVFGYGTAGQVFGFPFKDTPTLTVNSSSTPDEVALRFVLPTSVGTTYKIRGARISCRFASSTATATMILYSGTTLLQDIAFDPDFSVSVGASRGHEILFDETSLTTLTTGVEYRLALQGTGAGSFVMDTMSQNSNAEFEPYSGGIDFYYSSRTDAGAWTDDTARQPHIQLILDDLTGGGGPVAGGRLTGGLQ